MNIKNFVRAAFSFTLRLKQFKSASESTFQPIVQKHSQLVIRWQRFAELEHTQHASDDSNEWSNRFKTLSLFFALPPPRDLTMLLI